MNESTEPLLSYGTRLSRPLSGTHGQTGSKASYILPLPSGLSNSTTSGGSTDDYLELNSLYIWVKHNEPGIFGKLLTAYSLTK